MDDEHTLKALTIIVLGVVTVTAIAGLTLTALFTDRVLWKAELLTFAGVLVLSGLGGATWWRWRRRGWHLHLDHNGHDKEGDDDPR